MIRKLCAKNSLNANVAVMVPAKRSEIWLQAEAAPAV